MFFQYLLDEDDEVRTNACFGLGVLCAVAQGHLLGQYETILARLSQVLTRETNRRMIDNVLSCLCRMIVVSPKHVPLNQVRPFELSTMLENEDVLQVLPVLFQHLPLKEDLAEVKSVFTCLHLLYEHHFSDVRAVHLLFELEFRF